MSGTLKKEELAEHVRKNRAMWEETSASYEERHAEGLAEQSGLVWGLWHQPEAQLKVLGEVAGKDILEYGCGAARWSIGLAQLGARPVGLDLSLNRLKQAQVLMQQAQVEFPLIQADAENVPFADGSFDIVFCDWGATTFCDPYRTVPEVARLLRGGGLFAFSHGTPLQFICDNPQTEQLETRLVSPYFGMHRQEWANEVTFQLGYGEWISLFRQNGLIVEDLLESQPPPGVISTYRNQAEHEWARQWPMEQIWRLRKGF
jgi:ubiquinone/menaquinone biosynthesis C-methylase UbiE